MSGKPKKDSSLILRIPKKDRDAFVAACEDRGSSASREIRVFIQKYLKKHGKNAE